MDAQINLRETDGDTYTLFTGDKLLRSKLLFVSQIN